MGRFFCLNHLSGNRVVRTISAGFVIRFTLARRPCLAISLFNSDTFSSKVHDRPPPLQELSLIKPRCFSRQLRVILKQRKKASKKIDLYKEFEKFFINLLNAGGGCIYHVRLQEITMFNYTFSIRIKATQ